MTDWRGELLERVRKLTANADPEIAETVKWRKPSNPGGVPAWEHCGILFTGETYKDKIKLTFARGAALADQQSLFNASLEAGTRRAIDLREGDALGESGVRRAGQGSGAGEWGCLGFSCREKLIVLWRTEREERPKCSIQPTRQHSSWTFTAEEHTPELANSHTCPHFSYVNWCTFDPGHSGSCHCDQGHYWAGNH